MTRLNKDQRDGLRRLAVRSQLSLLATLIMTGDLDRAKQRFAQMTDTQRISLTEIAKKISALAEQEEPTPQVPKQASATD